MNTEEYAKGFNAGFEQLQLKDLKAATTDLWEAIGIRNPVSFRAYRYGAVELKISTIKAIEAVFSKYGVTDNIWGE